MIHKPDNIYTYKSICNRILLTVILGIISNYGLLELMGGPPEGINVLTPFIAGTIFYVILVESVIWIDKQLEKKIPFTPKNFRRRILSQLGYSSISAIIILCALMLLIRFPNYERDTIIATVLFFLVSIIVFISISFIFLLFRIINKGIEMISEVEKLKVEKLEMSYRALQDQLNPHFFFNNLSILKSLIFLKKEEEAKDFITNFSNISRYALQHSDWVTIQVKEEIEFVKQYTSIHQERAKNSIVLEIELSDKSLNKELPPMTLQLLIENAIKHNIADETTPLKIKIFEDDQQMVVQNTLNEKPSAYSTKKGLENLKNRFAILVDKPILIEKSSTHFTVKLPLV
ncbi:sensor histidine kinase [Flammeovirga agarivorans]|uniref:Histidine kinase n=1 Tax=Flammeovirga agarivorans TaxID=2726742 RepID=A0A7X8SJ80_9BACT|nr:histidine kinase [Flammeovirga agarivorans]NLR91258.1 histidine kinase [Flammeovirga agarivorans]